MIGAVGKVRRKTIEAALDGKMASRTLKKSRIRKIGSNFMSAGRMTKRAARGTATELATARRVSQVNPILGRKVADGSMEFGKKSSRMLAGGLAIGIAGGAIMNRRGPAADRVNGVRNTGMYNN